jgi:hypothetical protein
LAVRLAVAAVIWSAGLLVAALVAPAYDGQTTTSTSQGVTLTSATLIQVHGVKAAVIVAIPLLVSAVVGFALYRRRMTGARWTGRVAWVMIGVLAVEALLGIASVGLFMLPVIILLVLAVRLVVPPALIRAAAPSQRSTAAEAGARVTGSPPSAI